MSFLVPVSCCLGAFQGFKKTSEFWNWSLEQGPILGAFRISQSCTKVEIRECIQKTLGSERWLKWLHKTLSKLCAFVALKPCKMAVSELVCFFFRCSLQAGCPRWSFAPANLVKTNRQMHSFCLTVWVVRVWCQLQVNLQLTQEPAWAAEFKSSALCNSQGFVEKFKPMFKSQQKFSQTWTVLPCLGAQLPFRTSLR